MQVTEDHFARAVGKPIAEVGRNPADFSPLELVQKAAQYASVTQRIAPSPLLRMVDYLREINRYSGLPTFQMGGTGLEPSQEFAGKTVVPRVPGAKSGALEAGADVGRFDESFIACLGDAWNTLPPRSQSMLGEIILAVLANIQLNLSDSSAVPFDDPTACTNNTTKNDIEKLATPPVELLELEKVKAP